MYTSCMSYVSGFTKSANAVGIAAATSWSTNGNTGALLTPLQNRCKVYPSGNAQIILYRGYAYARTVGWERVRSRRKERALSHLNSPVPSKIQNPNESIIKTYTSPPGRETNSARSLRRTRTTISDIIKSNDFDLFATFTFAHDRFSADKCYSRMRAWLHSQQAKHGRFRYLIVAEAHKKCEECVTFRARQCGHDDRPKAIHFHAVFGGFTGSLADSGKQNSRGRIFNLSGWRSGYSTAQYIVNRDATANYCRKYITKDLSVVAPGKKRYWNSQGLARPRNFENYPLDGVEVSDVKYSTPIYDVREAVLDYNYGRDALDFKITVERLSHLWHNHPPTNSSPASPMLQTSILSKELVKSLETNTKPSYSPSWTAKRRLSFSTALKPLRFSNSAPTMRRHLKNRICPCNMPNNGPAIVPDH